MKSLFNRQVERFVRERKRYKRWLALFLCLAVMVSSGTFMSLTREGRALDDEAQLQADSVSVETDETGAGGSSEKNDMTGAGGSGEGSNGSGTGQTEADNGKTDADGTGGSGSGSSAGGSGEDGGKPDADGITEGGAGSDADGAGEGGSEADKTEEDDGEGNPDGDMENGGMPGVDGAAGNGGKTEESEDSGEDGDAEVGQDEIVVDADETVSGNEEEMTDVDALMTVSDNDPVVFATLQEIIDTYERDELEGLISDGVWKIEGDSLVITMNRDYDEALYIPKGKKIVLDLAGNTLRASASGVSDNGIDIFGEFVLRDSSNGNGRVTSANSGIGGVYIEQRAKFVMEGGVISGFSTYRSGAGVFVGQNATFTMKGGSIVDNTTKSVGGAVYIKTGGNVILSGESVGIRNNSAENGGAIAFEGQPGNLDWSGISLENNKAAQNGGAIYMEKAAKIKLTDAHFSGNTSKNGGVIYAAGAESEITMENSAFADNSATANGGILYTSGAKTSVTIADSMFMENSATGSGGVAYASGAETVVTITDSTFTENAATGSGGVVYTSGAGTAVAIADTEFTKNATVKEGGVIYADVNGRNTVITISDNTVFQQNEASECATIKTMGANSRIELMSGVSFRENKASIYGGAIGMRGAESELTADGVVFERNIAGNGGGAIVIWDVATNSKVTITDSQLTGNVCGGHGGAIGMYGPGTMTIDHSVIEENEAKIRGGGVYMAGALNNAASPRSYFYLLNGSRVVNNRFNAEYSANNATYGGGICLFNCVTAKIGGSTADGVQDGEQGADGPIEISNNKNACYGGGVYLGGNSQLYMEKTEVAANDASVYGGGIYIEGKKAKSAAKTDAVLELRDVNITGNFARDWGGGLYTGGGNGTISGGSISDNKAGGYGGGIFKRYAGDIKVTDNARIAGNTAMGRNGNYEDGYGGGVFLWDGSMTLTKGEIVDNTALRGGGVAVATWESDRVYGSDTNFTITRGSVYNNSGIEYGDDILVAYQTKETTADGEVSFMQTASVKLPAAKSLKADNRKGVSWQEEIWVKGERELKEAENNPQNITGEIEKENADAEYDYCYTFIYQGKFNAVASVTIDDGEAEEYLSVKEALDAVEAAQKENKNASVKVTLLKDVWESVLIPEGMTVTLDLDGHTITNGGAHSTIRIEKGAKLVIDDTAEGGKITGASLERITYGNAEILAGLMVDGEVTLLKGTICNNYPRKIMSNYYTGVYISQSGTFRMEGGKITGNRDYKGTKYGNGVVINYQESYSGTNAGPCGTFIMNGGEISENYRAVFTDGNATHRSSVTINNAQIINNGVVANAEDLGGYALRLAYCDARVENTLVAGNQGRAKGDTICINSSANLELIDSTISGNDLGTGSGTWGGGLYIAVGGSATVKNTDFTGNRAGVGGAIHSLGSLKFQGECEITGNEAKIDGGGVYLTGTMTIDENAKVLIRENSAGEFGGGIYSTGTMTADENTKVLICENSAGESGGGIYCIEGHSGNFSRAEIYENTAMVRGNDIHAVSKKEYQLPKAPESGADAIYTKWRDENAISSKDRYLTITEEALKPSKGVTYDLTAANRDEVADDEKVAKIIYDDGTAEKFETIEGAVKAVSELQTSEGITPVIYLLRDVTQERVVEIAKKTSITIDLNGYTLTSETNRIFSVKGALTIQDTTGDEDHNGQSPDVKGRLTLSESRANGRAVVVDNEGALTVNGGIFSGFKADRGGAVYSGTNSTVTINGGSFENNTATGTGDKYGGGAIFADSKAVVTVGDDARFTENTANGHGGAIYSNGNISLTVNRAVFEENMAEKYGKYGGAVYAISTGSVTFDGTIVRGNTAGYDGGAVSLFSPNSITITGALFENNSAVGIVNQSAVGGAVYATGYENLAIGEDTIFRNNYATQRGGALYVSVYGTTEIGKALFYNNTAESDGGAIVSNAVNKESQFIIGEETVIRNNRTVNGRGGAIYVFDNYTGKKSDFIMNGGTISENTAVRGSGGGIYADNGIRSISINGGVIRENTAGTHGGGIYVCCGKLEMTGGEIRENTAKTTGGGVYSYNTEKLEMTGGEICENHATDAGGMYIYGSETKMSAEAVLSGGMIRENTAGDRGGGIYVSSGTKVRVTGTTVTGNRANNRGGGVYIDPAKLDFELAQGGKLYGNAAGEGADIYTAYSGNVEGRRVYVTKATEMFSAEENMKASAWLDETTEKTFDGPNNYAPPKRAYALTLILSRNGEAVAMIGEKPYYTLQAAIDAIREDDAVAQGSEIFMIKDIRETVEVPVGIEAVLNLNGYELTGQTRAINCRGKLTILDEKKASDVYPSGDGVGTITGYTTGNGGAILVENAGQVKMESGRIYGSRAAKWGGAVYIENGTFELGKSAEITECTAKGPGSAVAGNHSSSIFQMTGGRISGNSSDDVGAIYLTDSAKGFITGGEISENTAKKGAAIYLSVSASVSISGSSEAEPVVIEKNESTDNGGAIHVYMDSRMTIGNARIADNRSKGGLGGAIYFGGGTMTIDRGTDIENNSATRGGAVYQAGGTMYMIGGQICNNQAGRGGGIAQTYNTSMIFIMSGGLLAGNHSTATGVGNDFYSMYEGAKPRVSPDATIMRAQSMEGGLYKTWHDDLFELSEEETDREDSTVSKGEYLVGSINESDNLALTATKYRLEEEIIPETDVAVKSIVISSVSDGTVNHNAATQSEIAASEKTAADMLKEDPDHFRETDQVYRTVTDEEGNTTKEYMIEGTVGGVTKLYEPSQAVLWSKGNDANKNNGIVRSYDSISYSISMPLQYDSLTDSGEENDSPEDGMDPSEERKNEKLQLWVSVDIPYSSEKAGFSGNGGMKLNYIENRIDEEGTPHQTLSGYYEIDNDPSQTVGKTISLTVYGMKDGETVKPEFKAWIAGNKKNMENPKSVTADTITVSAIKSYNVSLERNSELEYTGYFELDEGRELSVEEYNEAVADGGRNVVYGTLLGYGVTVEMRNAGANSGVKGIEAPDEILSFDVDLAASMYLDGNPAGGRKAPYFWAYKENDKSLYGKDSANKNNRVRMNWNDEDDVDKTTSYAYGATPVTTSLFNAGVWNLDGCEVVESVREGSETAEPITDKQMRLHFKVSNYSLAPNLSTVTGKSQAISAGYIQIICPIDDYDRSAVTGNQYLSVTQDAVVSSFRWASLAPEDVVSGDDEEDMRNMIDFFGVEDYAKYAVNETQYKDNFKSYELGMIVSNGDGISREDGLIKVNDFLKSDGSRFEQSWNGLANTPLGTDIYITGRVDYSSGQYDTTDPNDPYYNEIFLDGEDNKIERNYMTSLNILQKFDADVFTPVGTEEPIIDRTYSANGRIENGAFYAYANEGVISWDQSSNPKTKKFRLTVLYAAKPDGENWEKAPRNVAGQGSEVIATDDGGAADMEKTGEKDLIYYTTLAALQKDGKKCVGILYEVRDCCIRSGHYMQLGCKANVIKDFEKTGDTYCTTNEVYTFSTYRPAYKDYYNTHKADKDFSMMNSGLLNTFSWADERFAEGNCYRPGKNGADTDYKDVLTTGNLNTGKEGKLYVRYAEKKSAGYGKTEYSHGIKIPSTHGSPYLGNSILFYTLNSGISITNTDLKTGSNKRKDSYDLGQRERTVNYKVKPELGISSSVKDYDLVTNGTQSAQVTVILELPKYVNYNEGSLKFNYEACKATETDMNWSVHVEKMEGGKSVVTLTSMVADIDLGLPEITYNCTLGKPGSSDDVPPDTVLTVTASIRTEYKGSEYSEGGRLADVTRSDSISIKTTGSSTEVIWINVDDDKFSKLEDMGDDLVYTLHYENRENYSISDVSMLNVLPYVGDRQPNGRNSSFTGGYQVKKVEFIFESEESYRAFLGEAAASAGGVEDGEQQPAATEAKGTLKWTEGATVAMHDKQTNTADWHTVGEPSHKEAAEGKYSVSYDVESSRIIQRATDEGAKALYGLIPSVAPEEEVVVKITLSPKEDESGAYITDDNGKTQQGLQLYYNSFSFWSGATDPTREAVESLPVYIKTVKRSLTGTVWMDQDQSGTYVKAESVPTTTDRPIRNVKVSLYTTDTEHAYSTTEEILEIDGRTYYPAKDINSIRVDAQRTNQKGEYKFENLAQGTYFVFISDEKSEYGVMDGKTPALQFSQLSVTPDRDTKCYESKTGPTATDKAVPYYKVRLGGEEKTAVNTTEGTESGIAGLVGALISNGEGTAGAGITLPAAQDISDADYYSPNWNCGFYYMTQNIEKRWEQMSGLKGEGAEKKGVPTGAKVTVTEAVTGIEDELGYGSYKFEMTQSDNSGKLDEVALTGVYPATEDFVKSNFQVNRDDGRQLITWSVKDIPLQAETSTAKENGQNDKKLYSQKLDYGFSFEEKDSKGQSLVGYIVDAGEREVAGSSISYKITNTKIVVDLNLKKISTERDWDGDVIPLGGATYRVYRDYSETTKKVSDETGIVGTSITSGDRLGMIYLKGLEEGDYYIVETAAPKGYTIDETVYHVNISYPQTDGALNTNKPEILVEAIYSSGDRKQLAKYSMDGREELNTADYGVTLTKTPELPEGATEAERAEMIGKYTCYIFGFDVRDACIYRLPSTGGIGVFPYVAAGTLLLMAAAWLVMRKRREEVLQKGRY